MLFFIQKYIHRSVEHITKYLVSFFELQFVITLLSLPLLILWGLPISIGAPLANLIFTPLLIIFLWLSCCITICILCNIPCEILMKAMSKLSDHWIYILSFSRPDWLIGFPTKMLWLSVVICGCIVLLYTFLKTSSMINVVALFSFWIVLITMQPYYAHQSGFQQVGILPLWVTRINNSVYLIDNGALCTRKNMFSNFDYTVLPELIKSTGLTTVDAVMFCKPSNQIARAIQMCRHQLGCDNFLVTSQQQCAQKALQNGPKTHIYPLFLPKQQVTSSKNTDIDPTKMNATKLT